MFSLSIALPSPQPFLLFPDTVKNILKGNLSLIYIPGRERIKSSYYIIFQTSIKWGQCQIKCDTYSFSQRRTEVTRMNSLICCLHRIFYRRIKVQITVFENNGLQFVFYSFLSQLLECNTDDLVSESQDLRSNSNIIRSNRYYFTISRKNCFNKISY